MQIIIIIIKHNILYNNDINNPLYRDNDNNNDCNDNNDNT